MPFFDNEDHRIVHVHGDEDKYYLMKRGREEGRRQGVGREETERREEKGGRRKGGRERWRNGGGRVYHEVPTIT